MVCLAGGVCSVYRAGSSVDGADFDLVCWRRSDCVCPVDRGVNLYIQLAVFVVVSFLLLYSTRPLALRYINQKTVRTNVDALVGKKRG